MRHVNDYPNQKKAEDLADKFYPMIDLKILEEIENIAKLGHYHLIVTRKVEKATHDFLELRGFRVLNFSIFPTVEFTKVSWE